MRMRYKYAFSIITIIFIFFGLLQVKTYVLAEQSGSSPESGVTSRIKTIYDSLVSLTHGSDSAGGWGNWGVMWNRIRSAAEWVPTGDATEADVANGITFYNTSRTQKTGIASLAPDWSTFSLQDYEDCRGPVCSGSIDEDTQVEEATWLNTAGSVTTGVWKDTRTGLYWTVSQGLFTNVFTRESCDFFTTTPRGSYAGGEIDCGDAINACANLSLEAVTGSGTKTDWYLPSQKEMQIAYIDGIYNTNSTFTTTNSFWTSTASAYGPGTAWTAELSGGYVNDRGAGSLYRVRCVRRD